MASMVLVGLSCLMEIIVLNVHYRGENGKNLPNWARKMFLEKCGKYLLPGSNRYQSRLFSIIDRHKAKRDQVRL